MPKMTDDDFDESTLFGAEAVASIPVPKPVALAVTSPAAESDNPLSKYFRLPGLSVSLPTGGAYFPAGAIELDDAGEVAVYPMRAADEMLLASPDALMNNSAIISLIRSCVPAIKRPEFVSSPDLDVLLVAIRVASNGETMEIQLECPECKKPNTFEVDLPAVLGTMTKVPAVNPLRLSDEVVVYLRPHNMATQGKILISAFRETRAAQAIALDETLSEEEKGARLSVVMERLTDMNLFGLANSVVKVVVPGYEVTNVEHIKQFLGETDKGTLNRLRDELERINSLGIDKTVPAACVHCAHEWEGAIEFNPATFFEDRSSD
jgi:hypothetical protein